MDIVERRFFTLPNLIEKNLSRIAEFANLKSRTEGDSLAETFIDIGIVALIRTVNDETDSTNVAARSLANARGAIGKWLRDPNYQVPTPAEARMLDRVQETRALLVKSRGDSPEWDAVARSLRAWNPPKLSNPKRRAVVPRRQVARAMSPVDRNPLAMTGKPPLSPPIGL